MRTMGPDPYLEELADKILADDRRSRGRRKKSEETYLTPGQLGRRKFREVYNKNGFPEPHLYSGLFRRAYDPRVNKRKANPSDD